MAAGARIVGGVRWRILALLTGFSLVSYVERINLTVAARFIRDEFHLTDVQIGWTFSAFLIGYTLAQMPAGALSDRFGAYRVLGYAALAWSALTVALGVAAGVLATTGAAVLASVVVLRFLLGLAEGPTYPAITASIAHWFPRDARGVPNAVVQSASYAGEALTVGVIAALTAYWGWREALFASAAPALILALAWLFYATSRPREHRSVGEAELAYIGESAPVAGQAGRGAGFLDTLRDRNVLVLSLSYFCQGYVLYLFFFWFFIYLVDVRHFQIATGGLVAGAPTLAAALCALLGGPAADLAARRLGAIRGRRVLIVAAALVGAVALLVGANAGTASLAVAGFATAVGTRGFVESAYWSVLIDVSRGRPGSAAGVMNMMSNLGGVASTALAPVLVSSMGWTAAFYVAAALTVFSGIIMLGLQARRGGSSQPAVLANPQNALT